MINAFTVSLLFIIASFLRLLLRRLDARARSCGGLRGTLPRWDSMGAWSRETSIRASSGCGDLLQAVDGDMVSRRLDPSALLLFDS
jgi:hypothetical protein